MKTQTLTLLKFACISGICIAVSGCASLRQKTLKAPCGPLAGMTDPCGDRVPVNTLEEVESIFSEEFADTTPV